MQLSEHREPNVMLSEFKTWDLLCFLIPRGTNGDFIKRLVKMKLLTEYIEHLCLQLNENQVLWTRHYDVNNSISGARLLNFLVPSSPSKLV